MSSIISGMTNSFAVLFVMRFTLGLFVSAVEPASFSILGDYFPSKIRATANSLFSTGGYLGAGSASVLLVMVEKFGWRTAYFFKGGMGVLIAALAFLVVKEPKKGIYAEYEK